MTHNVSKIEPSLLSQSVASLSLYFFCHAIFRKGLSPSRAFGLHTVCTGVFRGDTLHSFQRTFVSYCLSPKLSRHRQRLQAQITSDQNASGPIGLVKEVAMNGQQSSTLHATLRWGDSSHLWARCKSFH